MNKKILIVLAIVILGGAAAGASYYFRKTPGPTVTVETIRLRDLEAVVSASGKIQPKRLVNISADASGRVVDLAVNEGDRVTRGQFLLQIDPKSLRTRVDSGNASLQAAEGSLDQQRQSVETARVQLDQAQKNLARQRDLWSQQLTTRESLDKAENDVKAAESGLRERFARPGMQAVSFDLTGPPSTAGPFFVPATNPCGPFDHPSAGRDVLASQNRPD